MNKLKKNELAGRIALLIASFFWGTTFVVISSTNDFFPPAFLVFMRCAIGAGALMLFFIRRFQKLSRQYIAVSAFLGFLMTIGYLMQGFAITNAGCPPGRCGFLVATYCVLIPFISWAVEKKKPNIYHIIAAVICLIGILFISLPDLIKDSNVCVGSIVFGCYLVYLSRYVSKLDPVLLTIGNLFFGAVYAGLYSFFFENTAAIVWNSHSIFAAVYLGFVCMSVTNVLQAVGQQYTPASTAALIFSLESVFGIIIAVLFWHEKVTPSLVIGCFFIFIAIVISETKLGFLKKKLSSTFFRRFFS